MEVGSAVSVQASTGNNQGDGISVIKLAQDQQKADGQAAVQLIESASIPLQGGSGAGSVIDVHV